MEIVTTDHHQNVTIPSSVRCEHEADASDSQQTLEGSLNNSNIYL